MGLSRAILGVLLLTATAQAQRLDAFSFRWDTRYDNVDRGVENDRLQGSVRLNLSVDVWSLFDLVGFAATGSNYTSRWTTLKDFIDDDQPDFSLYFRQLYLQRRFKKGRVQVGAIPPIKNIASGTGLNSGGWIDGARGEVYLGDLTLEAVAGTVGRLDEPDLFSRSRRNPYYELEASWKAWPSVVLEASAEYLTDSTYLRSEGRVDLPLWRGRSIEARGELISNVSRSVLAGEVGVAFDLVKWITGDIDKRLGVDLTWRYLDPDIGLRGRLTDDFYTFGHATTLNLNGRILADGVLHWFSRVVVAERPRLLAGIGVRFEQ